MTLPRHDSFSTDDPDELAEELERFYEDIAREFAGLPAPQTWTTEDAIATVIAARVGGSVIVLDANVTVRPPTDAEPGQCFRVVCTGAGVATVQPDDGTLVDGAPSLVINVTGYREFMFARGGWWPHL